MLKGSNIHYAMTERVSAAAAVSKLTGVAGAEWLEDGLLAGLKCGCRAIGMVEPTGFEPATF